LLEEEEEEEKNTHLAIQTYWKGSYGNSVNVKTIRIGLDPRGETIALVMVTAFVRTERRVEQEEALVSEGTAEVARPLPDASVRLCRALVSVA
jgi:hypothetical protein